MPVLTKGSFNYFIDRNNAFKFQNYAFGAQFRFCFALLELGRFNSLANYLKNKVKKWTITEWNSVARANQFPIIISCSILPKQLDTCRVFCQAFFIRLHVLGRCLLFNLVPGVRFLAFEGKKSCTCHKLHACPRLTQEMCGSASGAKSPCFQVEFWPVCYVRFISQIILNSMHKYQPRFHVILDESEKGNSRASLHETNKDHLRTFIFPETQFMAVTAYQNHMVSFFLFC